MQNAAVIPKGNLSRLPTVLPDARRLAGVACQLAQKRTTLMLVLAENVAGMAANKEVLATRRRMRSDNRVLNRGQIRHLALIQ
jgi:hypothetical protein